MTPVPATAASPATPAALAGDQAPIVLRLDGIERSFGVGVRTVRAVAGVDLTVRRGEIVALLGPNGAGKTTTLDLLLGLIDPSAGTVRVLGERAVDAAASGRIAAVLQTGGLLGDITVRETVEVIASLHGRQALRRVPDTMRRAGLEPLARRRVSKCSGGEQQRVRFALALVADPDILVLDEPTAGMDVTARHRFWDVMRAEADAGRTIVFATHYLEEAEQFARRTVVMHRGRIVADAPTAQLRASLGARTVAATLPADADAAARLVASLAATDGVTELREDAGRIRLRAVNADAAAFVLLRAGARDLEVTAPTLETAFTALTED